MNWWENLDMQLVWRLALPILIAVLVIILTLLLRTWVYRRLHRWSQKTESKWDDIIIHATRPASILWCFWLGIYAGLHAADLPAGWENYLNKITPILFTAFGIYTGVVLINIGIAWYKAETFTRTKSSLNHTIILAMEIGIPLIAGLAGLYVILLMLGVNMPAVTGWLSEHGARLAFLIVLAIVLLVISTVVIPRIIRTAVVQAKIEQSEEESNKRADTLSGVLNTTTQILIILAFTFMILSEVGINIAPVLAGFGVAGIAIGFGAQSLVKDIISGLFVIMENQFGKGDVVKIADVSGLVEDINLRRTLLRDMDGILHTVPNGEIRVASNFTKEWSRVNLNVSVSYSTSLEKAMEVIDRVGKELAADPKWASFILTPPHALRVDNFGASGIEIKILGETKPIKQWDIMGELRLRLKNAFDKEGIEIPFPHTKVYFGNEPPNKMRAESKSDN